MPRLLFGRDAAAAQAVSRGGSFGRAKSCILLFMWGGPAHQDTWDLKPEAPAEIRGEFRPISSVVPGIQIGEHFPLIARRTDKLAIVRSMTHGDVNHTTATHYLLTGQPSPPPARRWAGARHHRAGGGALLQQGAELRHDWPALGSVLAKLGRGHGPLPPYITMRPKLENDVPRFVEESHGQTAGWLGQSFDPLIIDADPSRSDYRVGDFSLPAEISARRLDDRKSLLTHIDDQRRAMEQAATVGSLDSYYNRAFELLHSATGSGAFDLSQEPNALRDRYGRNPHGQSVLQARRLVERGVPLVTVFWPSDGIKNVSVYWDTHSRNFKDLKTRP